jgi:transposase
MSKATRRRHTEEFKADAIKLIEEQGYGVSEAARRLGIDRGMLDRWRRERHGQQRVDRRGASEVERDAELRRLREENRKLLIERDILKNAAAFFAKESS